MNDQSPLSKQTCGVPGSHDYAAVSWFFLNFANNFAQLVDALPGVIRIRIDVVCTEVPPLEPVDGPQVSSAAMPQPSLLKEFL
jgi:hypothetical protein